MSKSLRMLLLSMLVIAVAAMPAMASNITFRWTGAQNNQWIKPGNWSVSADDVASYAATNLYPGNSTIIGVKVGVIISTDADIVLEGGLTGSLDVISIEKAAKVSMDFSTSGYFVAMPKIAVTSGELKLTSTTTRALGASPTWSVGNKSKLTLNMPATVTSSNQLTISVDNYGTLTINQASLLDYTTIKAGGSNAVVYLNAQPAAAASSKRLMFNLNGATLNTPSDVTLYANYDTSDASYPVFASNFVKAGAGTLTLSRTAIKSYDVPISSDVNTVTVSVGTLALGSTHIAESAPLITIAKGASLDVAATNAISTDQQVQLKVSGNATIAKAGIGNASDIYTSNVFNVNGFNLSADVPSGGKLTFTGSQPVKHLSGAGTVVVSGTDAELIVNSNDKSISGFTGTLDASTIGLAVSFDDMPFVNANSSIAAINVYGDAELVLDEAKLADVSGMDELIVHLYSDRKSVSEAHLTASTVGSLKVSGDVTLGTLRVDGSKAAPALVYFNASSDVLTVNTLVLHANKEQDSSSAPTYSFVDALVISGDGKGGTFAPKAISNATDDTELGSTEAITVQGATLALVNDLPKGNGLYLKNAKLDAANGVVIPEDLTLSGDNTFKLVVTGDNMKLYTGGHNAVNVGNSLVLAGKMSLDIDLQDDDQSIANKYRLIGPSGTAFNSLISTDFEAMSVTGTLEGAMTISYDAYGVYGILDRLALQPRVLVNGTKLSNGDSWSVSSMPNGSDFKAAISYDIPANVEPATLINLISIDVAIAGRHFNDTSTARGNIDNVVYLKSFNVNSPDKEIVLTGTLYADKVETTVTLGWATSKDVWAPYEKAGINFKGQSVLSIDFKPAEALTLVITNPVEESEDVTPGTLSEDATADPNEIVIEAETPEITAGSGDVVLTINGIREAVVANTSAKPVLVGEVYVWMNGFDNTKKYEMLYNGNWILMESLDIRIDGVSVNLDSVDISGSNPITVTIPAALFDTEAAAPKFQNVTIVGTAPNGHILTAGPASVHVVPDYEERPVDTGMGDIRYTTKDLPKSPIIVDGILELTGPFSFDLTVNGSPETPSWFTWNVNSADGTIAYEVAAGAAAGTYNMRVIAYTAEGGYKYNFTLTITEGFKINDPDEPYGTIGGLNYEARFTADNVPEGVSVAWDLPTNLAWLKSAPSGDVFVVYGQLPAYVDDEEAENDPNEYTYRVMATVSGDTVSKDWTITVEEDTDEVVDHTQFEAGEITFPEGKDIISADSTYSVSIAFNEDNYDTEIEFLSLPYWLKATPVTATVDDAEVITGYTITYNGKAVTAGETGVVRFEDPASGNIISWPVTFTQTIEPEPGPGPAPQSGDFTLTTASNVTLTLGTATGATSTLALETANALGEVSYTYTVTPNNGGLTVSISGSRATLTGSTAGTYTVTFTATDAGRPAGSNTATFATIVTVGGGVLPPATSGDLTLGLSASSVSMNLGTQGGNTRTVTLTTGNADGAVSYTYTVTPATGLTVAISGDVATLTATTAGTYTVTFTATDAAGRTATSATTVTVTSGVQPTPGGSGDVSQFSITVTPSTVRVSEDEIVSVATVSAVNATGEVEYTTSHSWVAVVDGTVVVDAPTVDRDTTYTVTITGTDSAGNTNTAQLTVIVLEGDIIPIVPGSVGSSGGGCDAGFGAMALALALPLFLRRRRS